MQWAQSRAEVRWIVAESQTVTSQCPCCGRMSWVNCKCPVNWIVWKLREIQIRSTIPSSARAS